MTRRQRLRTRPRFTAPGTMTNYELAHVREGGWWRDTRWNLTWESLGDAFHPRTQQEWDDHKGAEHGHDDGAGTSY